jgi:acyl dehydratase
MTLNPTFLGRAFPATAPYHVDRERIREFAEAVGEPSPACRDLAAAQALGHPAIVAPPTFPVLVTIPAQRLATADPGLGLDYSRVVHGAQHFASTRAVRDGDDLVVVVHIDGIRTSGANDILSLRSEVSTVEGEHVCTVRATLFARGTAAS